MYGLPQIYKSDIPFRPILSMSHSVQHSLGIWLIQVLDPILSFYAGFCVDDSFFFPWFVNFFLVLTLNPLLSFDITLLSTNVPLGEVISIYVHVL